MDPVALVEEQIDAGQRYLDLLTAHSVPVAVAFWARPSGDDRWMFYLATPTVDTSGTLAAYGQLSAPLREFDDVWLAPTEVTAIGAATRTAKAALAVAQKNSGRAPVRFRGSMLGDLAVEEAWVYPVPVKTKEIRIYGMRFRDAPIGFLDLSFDPHSPNSTLTVDGTPYPAETGIDWVIAVPVSVRFETDAVGRKVLAWDWKGEPLRATAQNALSLAELGLHGFRLKHAPAASAV